MDEDCTAMCLKPNIDLATEIMLNINNETFTFLEIKYSIGNLYVPWVNFSWKSHTDIISRSLIDKKKDAIWLRFK